MTVYSVRKMLVNPRLGRRRWSGIWPPSKPRMRLEPEREPWPLWPRVEVLPMPEPIPRPTRFLFSLAFLGARRLERLRIAIVPRYNAGSFPTRIWIFPCRRDRLRLAAVRILTRRRGRDAESWRPCRG